MKLPAIFPADEVIATYELVFLVVFAAGLFSFTNWIVMQYPQVGVTLAAFGVLFLWLARMVRKKKAKQEYDAEMAERAEEAARAKVDK